MKRLALALLLAATQVDAQTVRIKLGTLAPQGSTWHKLLQEMSERWSQASGGKVKLRIYAGGAQGSEGDMVRKMAVGQLQAAAISNVGMHDVVPEPQVRPNRLANVLSQRRARLLLDHADDLFL